MAYPPPYPGAEWQPRPRNPTLAIIALVVAILSLCGLLVPFCGIPFSLAGLGLGIFAIIYSHRGMGIAATIVSALGIALVMLSIAFLGVVGLIGSLQPTPTPGARAAVPRLVARRRSQRERRPATSRTHTAGACG
jgi:hypothetical protein